MSESRSEMKRGTEVFTAEMERLIGEMSKLSQDSLRHHVKRMRSLQRQCVAKRDGGRAYLFLRFADVAGAFAGPRNEQRRNQGTSRARLARSRR